MTIEELKEKINEVLNDSEELKTEVIKVVDEYAEGLEKKDDEDEKEEE